MKIKIRATILIAILIISGCCLFIKKSYSYTCNSVYTGLDTTNGNNIVFYCDDVNTGDTYTLSAKTAIETFGENPYHQFNIGNGNIYFYYDSKISESAFNSGYYSYLADERAKNYGDAAIRVKSTQQFESAIDDLYKNLKFGDFYFEFSPYEVDFDTVYNYYLSKYGVLNVYQNYYSYSVKGEQEPNRRRLSSDEMSNIKSTGEWELLTANALRISPSERSIVESYVNEIIPYIQGDGSDFQKIYGAYTLISSLGTVYDSSGIYSDFLSSSTSTYDTFISKKTVCIGVSISFSYLMDKMGIESYIVDNLTVTNASSGDYSSSHTYNIVKLDGKFYTIDIGSRFLTGVSGLYDSSLNTSSSSYSGGNRFNLDMGTINSIYNKYASKSTSNVNYVEPTTTESTTSNHSFSDGVIVTSPTNSTESTTNVSKKTSKSVVVVTNEAGEAVTNESGEAITSEVIIEEDENGNTTNSSNNKTTKKPCSIISSLFTGDNSTDGEGGNKTVVNIILFSIAALLLATLIYSIVKRNINSPKKDKKQKNKTYDVDIQTSIDNHINHNHDPKYIIINSETNKPVNLK